MKYKTGIICLSVALAVAGAARAESFLTAESFPKTFNDLSFIERTQVLAEGYEPFETEFDENGRCISGCPYQGFTLEDQEAQIQRNAELSRILWEQAQEANPPSVTPHTPETNPEPVVQQQTPETNPEPVVQPPQTPGTPPKPPKPSKPPRQDPVTTPGNNARHCSLFLAENRLGTPGPQGEPLAKCPRISSKYGLRTHPVTGKRKMHNGVDLPTSIGTNVYATGDGVVIKVVTNPNIDACGKYVKIQHPNGMISVYCHLSEIMVKQNENVQSGCVIAKSGNTGRTTGPHLHYSVRLSNNEGVDPEKWMSCKHAH